MDLIVLPTGAVAGKAEPRQVCYGLARACSLTQPAVGFERTDFTFRIIAEIHCATSYTRTQRSLLTNPQPPEPPGVSRCTGVAVHLDSSCARRCYGDQGLRSDHDSPAVVSHELAEARVQFCAVHQELLHLRFLSVGR